MLKVVFNYKGTETEIQCKIEEKMEEISKKYKSKIEINNEYYLYNGNRINKENKLGEIINNEDKRINKMNILVYDLNEINNNKNIKESKEIICPECNENVIIKLDDYKIEMKCINNHYNIILLKDYINKIDISKIKCNKCYKSRNETHNNEFYICIKCNINLCPLCKSIHDKNHDIINYDNKNYICNKHNENYTKYCCNKNICIDCENEHKNHKGIYYGEILPNINDEIKEYIDKFKKELEEIKNKLNNLIEIVDKYYNIYYNIIDIYKKKKKNYEILQNINEFFSYNKIIIGDLKQIIDDKDINIKFKNMMNLYNKINTNNDNTGNYIKGEMEIEENNKEIRIINSYEQYRREAKLDIEDKYKNEEEIKENIEITINDKKIPFTYFYKFEEKGKYKIKYTFKNKLTNTCYMFQGCSSLIDIDLSNFKSQNITFMGSMFMGCSFLININLHNFNTENATEIWNMFSGCSSLKNLDLSSFNTQKVTNMYRMFYGCSSLSSIDLTNFNTQKVTNMCDMFSGCSSLKNLDLSNFNTQNITDMYHMFYGCSSLKNLDLSNFNTQKLIDMRVMFSGCLSLRKNNVITNNKQILELLEKL